MASATAATASATAADVPLRLDSIQTVDLQLLSQSELYSLSLCSPSTFDPRRCDDIVIPKIDRSVFNESAGSRKQTYSRLRLAPASDPSAAAASASSIRRRTPHLRASSHNSHPPFLHTDPENEENRQIVALLKQLFGLESSVSVKDDNMEELVPIRVDYSDTLPHSANVVSTGPANVVSTGPANVISTGQKRKRGRPRKNANVVVLVENKVESQCDDNVSMATNRIVVCENVEDKEKEIVSRDVKVEDKDKEIVNRDGVKVDLVQLGSMEDPYAEELSRRTQGMVTEDQLLEFLKGLNGQWGSRRKKKRVVDASLFGNALPNGWKLLLSCKKKEGNVWLFCRRYISPNGRQFESIKEISAYLLSLHGIQDVNQPTNVQSNAGVVAVDKMNADLSVPNEKREENTVCQTLPSAVPSISGNYEVQVTMTPGDLPVVGETLHCEKCNLTFNGQDEFLQHQLSSHRRRRSKSGESISDGVIIKGGKYECQFCHKTFDERHRYNGHVGTHIRNQAKNSDESRATGVAVCVGSGSMDLLPHGNPMEPSTVSESNVAAELVRESADVPLNPFKDNGDTKELNDHLGTVDNSMDVDVTKSNLCFDFGTVFSNNVDTDEISGGANGTKSAVDRVKKSCNAQEMTSEGCSPFPLDKQVVSDNNVITFLTEVGAISGSVSHMSNEQQIRSSEIELGGANFSHTMNELRLEENKVMNNETLFGFCNKNSGLDNGAMGDKQHTESSDDHSDRDVVKADGKSVSTATGSEQKMCSGGIMLSPASDKGEDRDRDKHDIFPSSTLVRDEHSNTGTYGRMSHESDKCIQEERGSDVSRTVASWNETGNVTGKFEREVSIGIIDDGPQQPKNPGSNVPSLSGLERSLGVEEYINKASARKVQEPHMNDAQNMRNSELVFPFSSSNDGIGMDAVNNTKHERGVEFRAFFPSENGKVFSAESNRISIQNHAGEKGKKESSGSGLLSQPCIAEPHEVYNMNKIFGMQVDEHKINVLGNSKSHELCLAFDSQANSSGAELEKYDAKGFDVHSGIGQTYGAQSNLSNTGHIAPKEGRGYGFDLRDSSFSGKTNAFENNFNLVYPRRVWEGPKLDEVGNSGNKFMAGFGSGVSQPVDDVLAGSIWRTGEENLLRPDLTDTSTPLIQSSNSFHTFDIISDKGHEGLFGVNQKYDCNSGFEGLTLGRTEPMEYSFMTAQSSNPLPEESKGFSFNADTQHGFDSSFWLGKDSLMQNITGQNQVPTLCVWCRNEFYEDATASGAQTGAIGSMCPTCNSRISQQYNVL